MGALPSKEIQEEILDGLRDLNQAAGNSNTSTEQKYCRRIVLVPMTSRFVCRVPVTDAAQSATSTTTTTCGESPSGSGDPSSCKGPASPSAAAVAVTPTGRAQGCSPPATENHFANPAEFPLVQQVYDAYCEPSLQFYCRKDGWGSSLHEMPDRLYFPTLDAFYAATVKYYDGQLVDTNLQLQERYNALRHWAYEAGGGSLGGTPGKAGQRQKQRQAPTTAPPRLMPTPCVICFHYPTNRLATAENPYDPSVYSGKPRCTNAATGSSGTEDGRGRPLAPANSVVVGPRSSLMAIGFVGLVPTRLRKPAHPFGGSSSGTGTSPRAAAAGAAREKHPVGGREGPVPFLKPPADNDDDVRRPTDSSSPAAGAGDGGKGEEEEYELVIFLAKSAGSFSMDRSLFMAISLYVRQCRAMSIPMSSLPLGPIRYSALLTDLVHQSFLRAIRVRVAEAYMELPSAGRRNAYKRLLYVIRQKARVVDHTMLTGRLSSRMASQLFTIIGEWWSDVERKEQEKSRHQHPSSKPAAAGRRGKNRAGGTKELSPLASAAAGATADAETAAADDNDSNASSSSSTLKKKKKKAKDAAGTIKQLSAPARYLFYGFVEDPKPSPCSRADSLLTRQQHQRSTPAIASRVLPSSGGRDILARIEEQMAFTIRDDTSTGPQHANRNSSGGASTPASDGLVGNHVPASRYTPTAAGVASGINTTTTTTTAAANDNSASASAHGKATKLTLDAVAADAPLHIFAIVGPNGVMKPTETLKLECRKREEGGHLRRGSGEDDAGDEDDDSWDSSNSDSTRGGSNGSSYSGTSLLGPGGAGGGGGSGGLGRASHGNHSGEGGQLGTSLYWPEGTVLVRQVDRTNGTFLSPCWEVAMESESRLLGLSSTTKQRRPAANAHQAGNRESADSSTITSRQRTRRRREGQSNRRNPNNENEDLSGAGSENGDDDATSGGSSSTNSSRGRRQQRAIPRRLRLVPQADVLLSWIKDHYLFARGAPARDQRWKRSYPDTFFSRMALPQPPPAGQPQCTTRSQLTKANLASLSASRSPNTAPNNNGSDSPTANRTATPSASATANAAATAAATADTYIWEFEHQGVTYGIALTPGFARGSHAPDRGVTPLTTAKRRKGKAGNTGSTGSSSTPTGTVYSSGYGGTSPEEGDGSVGSFGKEVRAAFGEPSGGKLNEKRKASHRLENRAVTTAAHWPRERGDGSDGEWASGASHRTDPNSEDMSVDTTTSGSSHSTLSAFHLLTKRERRHWLRQQQQQQQQQQDRLHRNHWDTSPGSANVHSTALGNEPSTVRSTSSTETPQQPPQRHGWPQREMPGGSHSSGSSLIASQGSGGGGGREEVELMTGNVGGSLFFSQPSQPPPPKNTARAGGRYTYHGSTEDRAATASYQPQPQPPPPPPPPPPPYGDGGSAAAFTRRAESLPAPPLLPSPTSTATVVSSSSVTAQEAALVAATIHSLNGGRPPLAGQSGGKQSATHGTGGGGGGHTAVAALAWGDSTRSPHTHTTSVPSSAGVPFPPSPANTARQTPPSSNASTGERRKSAPVGGNDGVFPTLDDAGYDYFHSDNLAALPSASNDGGTDKEDGRQQPLHPPPPPQTSQSKNGNNTYRASPMRHGNLRMMMGASANGGWKGDDSTLGLSADNSAYSGRYGDNPAGSAGAGWLGQQPLPQSFDPDYFMDATQPVDGSYYGDGSFGDMYSSGRGIHIHSNGNTIQHRPSALSETYDAMEWTDGAGKSDGDGASSSSGYYYNNGSTVDMAGSLPAGGMNGGVGPSPSPPQQQQQRRLSGSPSSGNDNGKHGAVLLPPLGPLGTRRASTGGQHNPYPSTTPSATIARRHSYLTTATTTATTARANTNASAADYTYANILVPPTTTKSTANGGSVATLRHVSSPAMGPVEQPASVGTVKKFTVATDGTKRYTWDWRGGSS